MAGQELQLLLATMRARPFDPQVDEATMRRRLDSLARVHASPPEVAIEPITLAGRPGERLRAGNGPHVLFLHGGGFVTGSPISHRHLAGRLAADLGGTVDVLDYRLAPEAPFPAAVKDCLAAYAALSHHRVALVGDSAGGNLVFTTAVAARDAGLPRPFALGAISPWVNLATGNISYDLIGPVDPSLSRAVIGWHVSRYLKDGAAEDPRASPLFAALHDLPPTLIQIGDREVFFGDAVELHQRLIAAGTDTTLSVGKEMFHVWHLHWPTLPQGRAAIAELAAFIGEHA
jgi:acetyl esterase/lipase